MPKRKKNKYDLKLKEMQKAWQIAHIKPKIIIKKNIEEISKNISTHTSEWLLIKKAINKLADDYPANVSNKNLKIWRPFEV